MWWPRLIASDVDGTLTESDGVIVPRFVEVANALSALGIPVVLATGRALGALAPILEQLPLATPLVAANGALIVDPVGLRIRHQWHIPADLLAEQTASIRRQLPNVLFGVERGECFYREIGYPAPANGLRPSETVSWHDLVARPAEKLTARWAGGDGQACSDAAAAIVGDALTVTSAGVPGLVEFTIGGVDKSTALAVVAAEVGIEAQDVLAFGDMPNDLPMLLWAGRGVAVDWSHPLLLREVIQRTPPRSAGGVAAYLESMLEAGKAASPDTTSCGAPRLSGQ